MKKFILAVPALLALAAVSCTKSEVLESNDGEIRFNVVANKQRNEGGCDLLQQQ